MFSLARSRWDGPTTSPSNHQQNFPSHSSNDGNTAAVSISELYTLAGWPPHAYPPKCRPAWLENDLRSGLYNYRYYLSGSSRRIYWRQLLLVFSRSRWRSVLNTRDDIKTGCWRVLSRRPRVYTGNGSRWTSEFLVAGPLGMEGTGWECI